MYSYYNVNTWQRVSLSIGVSRTEFIELKRILYDNPDIYKYLDVAWRTRDYFTFEDGSSIVVHFDAKHTYMAYAIEYINNYGDTIAYVYMPYQKEGVAC